MADAAHAGVTKFAPRPRSGSPATATGLTPQVMLRSDGECAYPVIDGVPGLLAPEMLCPPGEGPEFDLQEPRYAEAYEEMTHYNQLAALVMDQLPQSGPGLALKRILDGREQGAAFPVPYDLWIDAAYDAAAQFDCYNHLAPFHGKRILQLGGGGIHAVKFLLAGAAESWLVTPMKGECQLGTALAAWVGVKEQFHGTMGIAEELPFADESFDGIYIGGCLHHTVLELALAECRRVLVPGGGVAAQEPWRAPFYSIGTRIFGKREAGVYCHPLNKERLDPLFRIFESAEIVHHGALTRYPLLALRQVGIQVEVPFSRRLCALDDAIASLIPPLRRSGSSVAVLGRKAPASGLL